MPILQTGMMFFCSQLVCTIRAHVSSVITLQFFFVSFRVCLCVCVIILCILFGCCLYTVTKSSQATTTKQWLSTFYWCGSSIEMSLYALCHVADGNFNFQPFPKSLDKLAITVSNSISTKAEPKIAFDKDLLIWGMILRCTLINENYWSHTWIVYRFCLFRLEWKFRSNLWNSSFCCLFTTATTKKIIEFDSLLWCINQMLSMFI